MVCHKVNPNGQEFEQILGSLNSEGQGSLECCSPWGSQSDMTKSLNNKTPSKMQSSQHYKGVHLS